MMNIAMNPTAKSSDVVNRICPPQSVPIQLKIFTPVGMAMSIAVRLYGRRVFGGGDRVSRLERVQSPHVLYRARPYRRLVVREYHDAHRHPVRRDALKLS